MPDQPNPSGCSTPLVCPDCGTSVYGSDDVTCSNGHKPIRMGWWAFCECGHDAHYDMTTFCLKLGDGCDCEEYRPSDQWRQLTMRSI